MKDQKKEDNLRDLIVKNPRAQQRIDMKQIDKHVRGIDKNFVIKTKSGNSLWQI